MEPKSEDDIPTDPRDSTEQDENARGRHRGRRRKRKQVRPAGGSLAFFPSQGKKCKKNTKHHIQVEIISVSLFNSSTKWWMIHSFYSSRYFED